MKQGTLFYDRESGRYNFFMLTGMVTGAITAASIAEKSLSKTKRKSKMPKNAI